MLTRILLGGMLLVMAFFLMPQTLSGYEGKDMPRGHRVEQARGRFHGGFYYGRPYYGRPYYAQPYYYYYPYRPYYYSEYYYYPYSNYYYDYYGW